MAKQLPIFETIDTGVYTPMNHKPKEKTMRKLIDLPISVIKKLKQQAGAKKENPPIKIYMQDILIDQANKLKSFKPKK